jgi:hypothetical protein
MYFNQNITFMDMAPRSLKTQFTSFEKLVKPSPVRLYCLFHDMSFLIPLHAIKKNNILLNDESLSYLPLCFFNSILLHVTSRFRSKTNEALSP